MYIVGLDPKNKAIEHKIFIKNFTIKLRYLAVSGWKKIMSVVDLDENQ